VVKHLASTSRPAVIIATVVFSIAAPGLSAAAEPSPAQREQVKANYMRADVNGDRMLEESEFIKFVNLNADSGIGRFGMIRRFGLHSRAFSRIDADRNGLIEPEELAEMSKQRR
jgi:hypothetical protein